MSGDDGEDRGGDGIEDTGSFGRTIVRVSDVAGVGAEAHSALERQDYRSCTLASRLRGSFTPSEIPPRSNFLIRTQF